MSLFDIQSLFTNIPSDAKIGFCVDIAYNNRKKLKGMLNCHFKQLLP